MECVALNQDNTMARSSKLSIGSRRAGPCKIQNKIGRLLQAHYSSLLEQPVPSDSLRQQILETSPALAPMTAR